MTSLCKAMYIRFFLSNSRPAGESLADRLSTDWGASGHSERLPRDRKCRDETLDHRPSFVGDRYLRRNPQAKVVGDKKWGMKICIK